MDRNDRLSSILTLYSFCQAKWDKNPGSIDDVAKQRYGLAEILMLACSQSPYDFKTGDALVSWDCEAWDDLMERLKRAKDTICIPNKRRRECLTSKCDQMLQACRIQKLLSPIRHKLEKQVVTAKTGMPSVRPDLVKELLYV